MRRIAVAGVVLVALAATPVGARAATGVSTPEDCLEYAGSVHASACAPYLPHRADGDVSEWQGSPTMIAGRTTTNFGEYIYTDWLYDDYGPDLDGTPSQPPFRAQLAPVRGDYRYPDNAARYGNNAADLREVRLAADRKTLHVLVALQTMKAANAAIVQVALDGDASNATSAKGGNWPAGAGISTKGPEHFVTVVGNRARLTGPGGTRKVKSVANVKQNAIEVDVPLAALGKLAKRPRIWTIVGLNDGKGRFAQQADGAPAVFNAGFRHFETYPEPGGDINRFAGSSWSELRQSAVLATGDISAFGSSFNVGKLRRHESNRPKPLPPGKYIRIFRSKKDYGEGVDFKEDAGTGGDPTPTFKSRYQPYALYIPKGYNARGRNVLTLNGHSLDCSHTEYYTVSPNQLKQLGDQRKSIMVTPLSRGGDTWYIDAGLIDTIEAWKDAARHYRADRERTFITGYSMGGYMTYRLGLLMPDAFSKASVYVGPPAYQIWFYPAPPFPGGFLTEIGNTNKIVENAHNLPYEINHGNSDELVPIAGVQHQADTFDAAGNAYVFYRHSANDHFSFIFNDEWSRTRDFLGTKPRVKNPVQVIYKRYPAIDQPHNGLRFDRAYWVSRIQVRGKQRDPAVFGRVDAVTHGRGGRLAKPVGLTPEPVAGPVSPGTKTGQRQVAGKVVPKGNALDLKLTRVSRLEISLRRAGLTLGKPLRLHVVGDGPVDVVLRRDPDHARTVHVAGGTHTVTVSP
jgi:dienelactone hydrolase